MGTFVKTKFWLRIGVKNDQTSRLCQIFLHYFTLRIIFALQISVSLFKFVISYSFENEIHKYMDIDLRQAGKDLLVIINTQEKDKISHFGSVPELNDT